MNIGTKNVAEGTVHVTGKGAGYVVEGSKNLASTAAEKIGTAADVVGEKTAATAENVWEGKLNLNQWTLLSNILSYKQRQFQFETLAVKQFLISYLWNNRITKTKMVFINESTIKLKIFNEMQRLF